jgi:hypothetical protein
MKIILISGFLGTGKTSAILQLGGYLARRSGGGRIGVMIIENEIGEVGVDDKLLRAQGRPSESFSRLRLLLLGGDFLADIKDIKEAIDSRMDFNRGYRSAYPLQ